MGISEEILRIAYKADFVFSASKQVSSKSRSAPPSIKPRACSEYASAISSKEYGRSVGSDRF